MIYAATNNAIKEYSYEIKNSETPDKIVFLMINTSILLYIYIYIYIYTIYFKKNVFSKFALIFQIFQYLVIFVILGGRVFVTFLCIVVRMSSFTGFSKIRTKLYISIYCYIHLATIYNYILTNFFPKFAWRLQIVQKFGHSDHFLLQFFPFFYLTTKQIWTIASWT